MDNIISTKLFETDGVSVFRIPPGHHSLKKWNINASNFIWSGNIRVTEQEVLSDNSDSFRSHDDQKLDDDSTNGDNSIHSHQKEILPPHQGLRLKLELYNVVSIPPSVGNLTTCRKDASWAEVWYNPTPSRAVKDEDDHYDSDVDDLQASLQKSSSYSIANDGEETIQMTPESPKFYKIIAQLPGSGYYPYDPEAGGSRQKNQHNSDSEEESLVQVALGLKFEESFSAVSFAESLGIYKRRFRNFEDQFIHEIKLSQIEMKSRNLSLNDQKDEGKVGDRAKNSNNGIHSYDYQNHDNYYGEDDDDDDDDNDLNFYETNRNLFSGSSQSPHSPSYNSYEDIGSSDHASSIKKHQSDRDRADSAATSITVPDDDLAGRDHGNEDSSHEDDDDDEFGDFVRSV